MQERDKAHDYLKNHWLNLCNRIGLQTEVEQTFQELLNHYTEPHRYYHNLSHIQDSLTKLDLVKDFVLDKEAVELAIWFHDSIYDPSSKESEEKSASFAKQTLEKFALSPELIQRVESLILATKHTGVPKDFDEQILTDIDLSVLGEEEAKFDENYFNIRQEYKDTPDEDFMNGRRKFLQSMLERRRIFSTQFFYTRFEAKARKNIRRSIAKLNEQLS